MLQSALPENQTVTFTLKAESTRLQTDIRELVAMKLDCLALKNKSCTETFFTTLLPTRSLLIHNTSGNKRRWKTDGGQTALFQVE